MSNLKKPLSQHIGDAIAEVNGLEGQINMAHQVLDEINVPKFDPSGKELLLHERLSMHKDIVMNHLDRLRGLLDKYRR